MIGGSKNVIRDNSWFVNTVVDRNSFIGGGVEVAVAANYSHVELWNPAASGKYLICHNVKPTILTGIPRLSIRHHNVALGNHWAEGNKHLSVAIGVGIVRGEPNVAQLGAEICQYLMDGVNMPTFDLNLLPNAIVVPQGRGLIVTSGSINLTVGCIFQWIEIDV